MAEPFEIRVRAFAECGVLIVGGTSGVGLATALRLARAGARAIGLVGRSAERGEQARQSVLDAVPGANVLFIRGDANVVDEARRVVEQALTLLGSIDVLVNCTADMSRYSPQPLQDMVPEDIMATVLSVVSAPLLMSRLVLPPMRERRGGVILNVASDAAKVPTPGETVLGASMAAITMFSRTLAMEAKRFGIRVNAITPSLIGGTTTARHVQKGGFSAKLFSQIENMASLGVCVPDDLAATIVFLASPEAARLTGQVISVNGGISAG